MSRYYSIYWGYISCEQKSETIILTFKNDYFGCFVDNRLQKSKIRTRRVISYCNKSNKR